MFTSKSRQNSEVRDRARTWCGALLDILSEDFKEDRETQAFEPMDKGDAISEAMQFAERYETACSKS
jgi:hypothetical protein